RNSCGIKYASAKSDAPSQSAAVDGQGSRTRIRAPAGARRECTQSPKRHLAGKDLGTGDRHYPLRRSCSGDAYSICCSSNFRGLPPKTLGGSTDQPLSPHKIKLQINGTMRASNTSVSGWRKYAECPY